MIQEERWQAEVSIMNRFFPWFAAVRNNGTTGFYGYVRGPRTGRLYLVTVLSPTAHYPEWEPPVYIEPRVGPNCNRDSRGRLAFDRGLNPWRSTFANCVFIAIQYLKEYDK